MYNHLIVISCSLSFHIARFMLCVLYFLYFVYFIVIPPCNSVRSSYWIKDYLLTYLLTYLHRTLSLSPPPSPQRGWKPQNGLFPCKIALRLKKVCYKVSLCEYHQRQVVRHSLTSVRRLAVAKRLCDCSYSIFARSSSAVSDSENKFN